MVIRPVVTESREIGTVAEAQDSPIRSPPLLPATGKHDVSAREVPLPLGEALHKKSWAVIDRPYSLGCATVGALYEAVNELQSSAIPLLASPQGVAASSIRYCEATEAAAAGGVFLLVFDRKTTPASPSAEASRYFVTRSATPYSS